MAKRQGIWAELQRERARQARNRQQQLREFQRAEARAFRDAAKAERDRQRLAAVDERERKKLYVEDRKAEAAAMAEDIRARVAELGGLLKAGIRDRPVVTFTSLRRTGTYPAFDAGPLGRPVPPPLWEHFVPAEPSGLGKFFGGAGRFERQLDSARTDYAQAVERYKAAEAGRQQQLAAQRAAYDADAAAFADAVAEHNAGVDGRAMGDWRKSSYSDGNGGACVETASTSGSILVRDTTDRDSMTLKFTAAAWQEFTCAVKSAAVMSL